MNGTSRYELIQLIQQLKHGDDTAKLDCISFFCDESKGMWHNRARARIARNLKHNMLTSSERTRIVAVILRRLVEGNFFEQFSDQLNLALKLNPDLTVEAARKGLTSTKEFIRRKSAWLLRRQERIEKSKVEQKE